MAYDNGNGRKQPLSGQALSRKGPHKRNQDVQDAIARRPVLGANNSVVTDYTKRFEL